MPRLLGSASQRVYQSLPNGHGSGFGVQILVEANPSKKTWWRFSLREILLATAAVATFVALFQQHFEGQPTKFVRTLDVIKLIKQVGKQQQLTLGQLRGKGGQSRSFSDHAAVLVANRSFYYLADPNDLYTKIMPALRAEILDRLAEEGCAQDGEGTTGRKQMTELTRWEVSYKRGRLRGKFRAYTSFTKEGNPELCIMIDEW